MATAVEEYRTALKQGKKEVTNRAHLGLPYELPVLDEIIRGVDISGEMPLGLVDIPAELMVGTKTRGRTTAFSPSFLPVLEEGTEFAMKWRNLCHAHMEEGIHDPVIAYEYMNQYYVQEGNKRVSVLKYFGAPTIPAYVTRIIPAWKNEPKIRLYYEFLDFYNASNVNYLSMSKEGRYHMLNRLLGHKKYERWTMDERIDFRSIYLQFTTLLAEVAGKKISCTPGDAIVVYLDVFGYETMKAQTETQIKAGIKKILPELTLLNEEKPVAVKLDPTPEPKKSILTSVIKAASTAKEVRKVAFIHNKSAANSGWTYGHELGRMHIEDVFRHEIQTTAYNNVTTEEEAMHAIEEAIATGHKLIFTTTPVFLQASMKMAILHPEVKIMNCSLNLNQKYVRTYYGRMFEAKFLTGVLAGIMTDTDKIGYIANYPLAGLIANINAFAIGVKMVNPRAKVYLEWSTLKENEGVDLTEKFTNMGVTYISNQEFITPQNANRAFGLYRVNGETPVNLALPVWDWGKYYERIIRNIMDGAMDSEEKSVEGKKTTYWWGMSANVIDLVLSPAIHPTTRNLLETLKRSICRYDFNPFEGELVTQDGTVVKGEHDHRLTAEEIIGIDWLLDNVVGFIPTIADLKQESRSVVRQEGVKKSGDEEE